MTGREQAIGVGLAAVLVIGIIDAAAGHNGSSKPSSSGTPVVTAAPTTAAPSPSTPASVTPSPAGSPSRSGTGSRATSGAASTGPTAAPTPASSAPPPAPRHRPSSSPSAPPGVLGTFSYATQGYEQTNIPNTKRAYPSTTKITNKLHGCGVLSTWKPVSEHVQKQLVCPSGNDLKIASYQTSISFFGVTSSENFKCSGASYIYRPKVAAGTVWKYRCKSADATASQTARVIGYQTIDVGGNSVRTLHVHVDTKLTGNSSGTSSQDYWIATSKPVLVKEAGIVKATQQSVHYYETYSLALKSLSPKT
ncbi:MAG: hypothetical protein ACTHK4_06670 [Mycobacteriales bacterium]